MQWLQSLLVVCSLTAVSGVSAKDIDSKPAPQFTGTDAAVWLNSAPLKIEELRGKVVLLDFWTFDCWNCYRSFPWLESLEDRYQGKGLQVVGIHTPEFAHEKIRANVEEKVKEFNIRHPVMMDNDFGYWNAMRNRYWPAFYLIDKSGNIRAVFIGETHAGDRRARAIEDKLQQLLDE